MVILDPYDMTFDAVGVFGLDFWLLFKSASSYCVPKENINMYKLEPTTGKSFHFSISMIVIFKMINAFFYNLRAS